MPGNCFLATSSSFEAAASSLSVIVEIFRRIPPKIVRDRMQNLNLIYPGQTLVLPLKRN